MVLTQAIELNIAHDDHLVVLHVEKGIVDQLDRIHLVA